jgi:hypothetical protein
MIVWTLTGAILTDLAHGFESAKNCPTRTCISQTQGMLPPETQHIPESSGNSSGNFGLSVGGNNNNNNNAGKITPGGWSNRSAS